MTPSAKADYRTCLCAVVKVGGESTTSRNWNPDCPVHPWSDAMQAQSDRAVELQRRAAEARRTRANADYRTPGLVRVYRHNHSPDWTIRRGEGPCAACSGLYSERDPETDDFRTVSPNDGTVTP